MWSGYNKGKNNFRLHLQIRKSLCSTFLSLARVHCSYCIYGWHTLRRIKTKSYEENMNVIEMCDLEKRWQKEDIIALIKYLGGGSQNWHSSHLEALMWILPIQEIKLSGLNDFFQQYVSIFYDGENNTITYKVLMVVFLKMFSLGN